MDMRQNAGFLRVMAPFTLLACILLLCWAEVPMFRLLPLIAVLFPLAVQAQGSDAPRLYATVAPDGQYNLVVEPQVRWMEAEITVRGDDSKDVGPAAPGMPVEVRGWTGRKGSLRVTIQAATHGGLGVTWMLEVDPDMVPVRPPLAPAADPAETAAG